MKVVHGDTYENGALRIKLRKLKINESLYSAAKDVMISSRRRESKKEHDLCKGEEMRIR